jgi:hypothetical protein
MDGTMAEALLFCSPDPAEDPEELTLLSELLEREEADLDDADDDLDAAVSGASELSAGEGPPSDRDKLS